MNNIGTLLLIIALLVICWACVSYVSRRKETKKEDNGHYEENEEFDPDLTSIVLTEETTSSISMPVIAGTVSPIRVGLEIDLIKDRQLLEHSS